MSSLSAELLKMRGKLREEHETILHELQRETIEKIEKELQESLKKLEEDIELEKENVVLGIMKIFVYHLDGSKSLFHDEDTTVSHDVSFYTSPDSEVNDLTSNIMMDAANEIMSMSNQYVLERQGELLEDVESVVEAQLHHIDFVGQQNWKNSVSQLSHEWDELSNHNITHNGDSLLQHSTVNGDDTTVRNYINDQASIADSIMMQELSFELYSLYKKLLFEFSLIHKQIHARAAEHKQSTELQLSMISNLSGTPNDVKLESVLMSQMKQYYDHLHAAMKDAKEIFIENITDSMKLCLVQQLQDTKMSQVKLRASLLELIDDVSDRFVRYSAKQHLDSPTSKARRDKRS